MILCLFFLFYFSPLFFLQDGEKIMEKKYSDFASWVLSKISPKESILLPLTLLYIAVYGFIFFVFSDRNNSIITHALISIAVFILFLGYAFSFSWKHSVFYDVLEYHTIFWLISVGVFGVSSLVFPVSAYWYYFFLWVSSVIASYFLLLYGKRTHFLFSSWLILIHILLVWIFWNIFFTPIIFLFFPLLLVGSIFFFEYSEKIRIFVSELESIRYTALFLSFISIPFFLYFQSQYFWWSIAFLITVIVFYFSIHVRYTNYATYGLGLWLIFYIYTLLFYNLLILGDILSVLLFIFFLPLLIIGNTYFWEQREIYDFPILHYSSIGFSVLTSLYALLFLPWWNTIFLILFSCIFGIALLFFMSYFRFRNV